MSTGSARPLMLTLFCEGSLVERSENGLFLFSSGWAASLRAGAYPTLEVLAHSQNRLEEFTMGKLAEFSTRGSKTGQTQRMRIYSLHEDQIGLIQCALKKARRESETEYDSVALTNICLAYISWGASPEVLDRLNAYLSATTVAEGRMGIEVD